MKSNILIYTLSIVAAVNFVYIGLIAKGNFQSEEATDNNGVINKIFMTISFIGAWYAVSMSIVETDFIFSSDNLAGISMLATGYIGPLFFMFSSLITNPGKALKKTWYLLLLAGLPGSIYAIKFLLLPGALASQYVESFVSGQVVNMGYLSTLFYIHTFSMAVFFLMSIGLILKTLFNKNIAKSKKEPVRIFLLALVAAVFTLGASNLLPVVFNVTYLSKMGPILTLPTFLITLKALKTYQVKIENIAVQKQSMKKYLSPHVIDKVFNKQEALTLGGELAEASILFIDIRGFTKMSESRGASDVVKYLNDYLDVMNSVIFSHSGMVDKFIGDAILVVFGVPDIGRNHRLDALNCANDMLKAVDLFNKSHILEDYELAVGIGVHTGEILHGNIGSGLRMEYTVIGDAVNTASRLEKLTKEYEKPIIFSYKTLDGSMYTDDFVDYLGEKSIRGKKDDLKIYTISDKLSKQNVS